MADETKTETTATFDPSTLNADQIRAIFDSHPDAKNMVGAMIEKSIGERLERARKQWAKTAGAPKDDDVTKRYQEQFDELNAQIEAFGKSQKEHQNSYESLNLKFTNQANELKKARELHQAEVKRQQDAQVIDAIVAQFGEHGAIHGLALAEAKLALYEGRAVGEFDPANPHALKGVTYEGKPVADSVKEFVGKNLHFVQASGASGAGSRGTTGLPPTPKDKAAAADIINSGRFASLSPAEQAAVRATLVG